jgi:hypothetical protein
MKQINEYISNKDGGSKFENEVKYSLKDWEKWLKLVEKEDFGKDLYIGNYDDDPDITLVFRTNDKDKHMDHIATYNHKKSILYCDDINLFGNEV